LIDVQVETISPFTAEQYLKRNTNNRTVSKAKLYELQTEIGEVGWRLLPDVIAFDTDGVLLNGQHRLTVISKGSRGVPMLVGRGFERTAMDSMDRGKKRNLGDTLSLRGEKYAQALGSVIRGLHQYEKLHSFSPNGGGRSSATESVLLGYFYDEARPDLAIDLRRAVAQHYGKNVFGISSTDLTIIMYCIEQAHGPDEATAFFSALRLGENLQQDNPVWHLRDRLMKSQQAQASNTRRNDLLSRKVTAALIIKAFNAWVQGDSVKNLRWRPGGSRPEPFPLVDGYLNFA
jgi:hypothetical protein